MQLKQELSDGQNIPSRQIPTKFVMVTMASNAFLGTEVSVRNLPCVLCENVMDTVFQFVLIEGGSVGRLSRK